jgi:hypothetical protein
MVSKSIIQRFVLGVSSLCMVPRGSHWQDVSTIFGPAHDAKLKTSAVKVTNLTSFDFRKSGSIVVRGVLRQTKLSGFTKRLTFCIFCAPVFLDQKNAEANQDPGKAHGEESDFHFLSEKYNFSTMDQPTVAIAVTPPITI